VSNVDLIPVVLLVLFVAAVATATAIVLFASRVHRRRGRIPLVASVSYQLFDPQTAVLPKISALPRPNCWMAVRSRNLRAVQTALHLSNPEPCSWTQGLANTEKLFIAPPIRGWILITGSGLPDPADDVDSSFRFLLQLSRKLGRVQFFVADRVLGHHAWVRAESGRIIRAYAWAGRTLWNQGSITSAETELGLKCFDYFESAPGLLFGSSDNVWINAEKVPLLAARWSIDPTALDERSIERTQGVAGEVPRLY
jgi:hypothetical protein